MHNFWMNFFADRRTFEGAGEGGGAAPAAAPAAAAPAAGDTVLGAPPAAGDAAPATPEAQAAAAEAAAKAAGAEPAAGDEPADSDAAATELKLTAPEGFEAMQADLDAFSTTATAWVAENPNATAVEALQWAAETHAAAAAEAETAGIAAMTKQIETWGKEAQADPDIGGDNFEANAAIARTAIEKFGSDDLKAVLNQSGLGSHPAVIKFAVNAGKALQDGTILSPNAAGAEKNLAKSLYSETTK